MPDLLLPLPKRPAVSMALRRMGVTSSSNSKPTLVAAVRNRLNFGGDESESMTFGFEVVLALVLDLGAVFFGLVEAAAFDEAAAFGGVAIMGEVSSDLASGLVTGLVEDLASGLVTSSVMVPLLEVTSAATGVSILLGLDLDVIGEDSERKSAISDQELK